jgi:A/G-specific adenine glycosylase
MLLNPNPQPGAFAERIVTWQRDHGRHNLPWQGTRDPYRIWLSEIMLQQTQVATVIGYYARFLDRFPDIPALAQSDQADVMPYWAGLGYYARARNLHRCAQELCQRWNGRFPDNAEDIATLPGIGRSTAAAIAAFAYGARSPIMDGNVKRVFTRYFGIPGVTSTRAVEQRLWSTADAMLEAAPATLDMAAYTQGLMDLGSDICTRSRPDCMRCPLADSCYALMEGKQGELPSPKPRRASPERHCAMLVLNDGANILLEQQPSPGIWGGLWSLPQYDSAQALSAACVALGHEGAPPRKMAGLLHVFTHFRLHIEPWYLHSAIPDAPTARPGQAWLPIAGLASTALPAPVKKILSGLFPQALP